MAQWPHVVGVGPSDVAMRRSASETYIYTVYIIMLIRFEDVLTSKSRVWLEFVDMCIYVSYSRRALQKEKV